MSGFAQQALVGTLGVALGAVVALSVGAFSRDPAERVLAIGPAGVVAAVEGPAGSPGRPVDLEVQVTCQLSQDGVVYTTLRILPLLDRQSGSLGSYVAEDSPRKPSDLLLAF